MKKYKFGHVVLTGASGAIGSELLKAIHRHDSSATFSLLDIDTEGASRNAEQISVRYAAYQTDLSKPDSLSTVVDDVLSDSGPANTLINCAGIMEIRSIAGMRWELAETLLNIDLISPLRLMNLLVPAMKNARGGCVINISSMAGRTPIPGVSYYGAAKAGIAMASEIARLELKQHNVRVVTVYPGPIESYLERTAKAQVKKGIISEFIPTGKPDKIAQKIVEGAVDNKPRVVYPPLYDVANRFLGAATWITSNFSPDPVE